MKIFAPCSDLFRKMALVLLLASVPSARASGECENPAALSRAQNVLEQYVSARGAPAGDDIRVWACREECGLETSVTEFRGLYAFYREVASTQPGAIESLVSVCFSPLLNADIYTADPGGTAFNIEDRSAKVKQQVKSVRKKVFKASPPRKVPAAQPARGGLKGAAPKPARRHGYCGGTSDMCSFSHTCSGFAPDCDTLTRDFDCTDVSGCYWVD